ncbi:hypothetical protein ACFQ1S_45620 [Kibdelosporangium lantanae]|uniref:Uncharacterized protein n=1 Tax=Kibdelosporangium lantanae TaxID=1497396 RepID=A0ABW3MNV9_9PSEU
MFDTGGVLTASRSSGTDRGCPMQAVTVVPPLPRHDLEEFGDLTRVTNCSTGSSTPATAPNAKAPR